MSLPRRTTAALAACAAAPDGRAPLLLRVIAVHHDLEAVHSGVVSGGHPVPGDFLCLPGHVAVGVPQVPVSHILQMMTFGCAAHHGVPLCVNTECIASRMPTERGVACGLRLPAYRSMNTLFNPQLACCQLCVVCLLQAQANRSIPQMIVTEHSPFFPEMREGVAGPFPLFTPFNSVVRVLGDNVMQIEAFRGA